MTSFSYDIQLSYGIKGLNLFISHLNSQQIKPSDVDCVAAIGDANGIARVEMTQLMQGYGFQPTSLRYKNAMVSHSAKVGNNLQLLAGSMIGASASVGDYSIVNSGANDDHDCSIEIAAILHLRLHLLVR